MLANLPDVPGMGDRKDRSWRIWETTLEDGGWQAMSMDTVSGPLSLNSIQIMDIVM